MISLTELGVKAADIKILVVLFSVCIVFTLLISFAFFILKALGIYEMSKTLGIKSKWFAFFPFFNDVAFGKLADCGTKKQSEMFKYFLVAVRLVVTFLFFLGITLFSVNFVDTFFAADKLVNHGGNITKDILKPLVLPCNIIRISVFVLGIYKIIYLFAFIKISNIFSRKSSVLLFIMACLFPILIPIFLFVMRKNKPILPSAYKITTFSEEDF